MIIKISAIFVYVILYGYTKTKFIDADQFQPAIKLDSNDIKHKLSDLEYYITQQNGTEDKGSGKYHKSFKKGEYHCVVCDTNLFSSVDKFDSGIGYPTFDKPGPNVIEVKEKKWNDLFVHCANCGAHLGNSYDGKTPWSKFSSKTGKTFVVNSSALIFKKIQGSALAEYRNSKTKR